MGVNISGTVPNDPGAATNWFDELFSGAGSLGEVFGGIVQTIFDTVGTILRTGLELGGALLGGIVDGVAGLIGAIADGLRGLLPSNSPFEPIQEAFYDGQRDLTDRLDLLEGVQGYAAAYQSVNINGEWGTDNWRYLPYDRQLGPAKNMHIDTYNGEIVLHSAGMFVAYAKAQARATGWGGNDYVYLDLAVLQPNGALYSYTRVEKYVPRNHNQTVSVAWPFVVPGPGYRVEVEVYSDNFRWWDGGTDYSTLHVIQHSNTSVNPGTGTVPDETR